ncbi:hypothetical protein CRD59_02925 [Bifidobacterium xylocopae]|uniref:Uncharacterized protein n=1 Tax=Bifidobacterium xylocopae TaxID=2493119 RepID=A0A366KF02_9BIFI|nr:hypothetical protein CRD59_02925 [Bifidobacterium xylocopae]
MDFLALHVHSQSQDQIGTLARCLNGHLDAGRRFPVLGVMRVRAPRVLLGGVAAAVGHALPDQPPVQFQPGAADFLLVVGDDRAFADRAGFVCLVGLVQAGLLVVSGCIRVGVRKVLIAAALNPAVDTRIVGEGIELGAYEQLGVEPTSGERLVQGGMKRSMLSRMNMGRQEGSRTGMRVVRTPRVALHASRLKSA